MRPQTDTRRRFLKNALPASALSVSMAAGLLKPTAALAWFPFFNFNAPAEPAAPSPAFSSYSPPSRAKTPLQALVEDLRHAKPETSAAVDLQSPDIAVDGASIMLNFQALLPEVDGLAVYIEGNPQPLAAAFHLAPNVVPEMKLLVRLAQSSNVIVVARSQGRYYRNLKFVKVTRGGCNDSFEAAESQHRREVQDQVRPYRY